MANIFITKICSKIIPKLKQTASKNANSPSKSEKMHKIKPKPANKHPAMSSEKRAKKFPLKRRTIREKRLKTSPTAIPKITRLSERTIT